MKTPKLLLSMIACTAATFAFAEVVPTHDAYVMPFDEGKTLAFPEYFRDWDPNNPQPLSEDENFYISRVPFKERFVNVNTQVDPEMTQDRKFCMWTPMGISDTYWQSLPRNVFDGDNFSMWSYVDSQGGWSLPWVRVPGAYADVTHKNGVRNSGGLIFFDHWGGDNRPAEAILDLITEIDVTTNKFKYVEKFIKFLRYYGLDGVGVNPEGAVAQAPNFQKFITECREYAESINWRFTVYWYGTNKNWGTIDLGSELTSDKVWWFCKDGKQVCDMYMLNYGWWNENNNGTGEADCLPNSIKVAEDAGGSSYDIYAGLDIQGSWIGSNWSMLKQYPVSIAFWGNHTTNMIYQNSSEYGSADEAVQTCYPLKQEQIFSGGNHNPANRPAVKNWITSSGDASMKEFHGLAEFLPARSVLQELPFVTRFGLGNGKAFYNEGKVTFNGSWFNVGVQDYLPTWRWWITDDAGNVPDDEISLSFNYDDAWFAGNTLKATGATQVSNVRLFKTKFNVQPTDDISLTFKLNKGEEACLELFWAFEGSESTLHYATIDGTKKGEWVTYTKKAQDIQMNGQVALIGFRFKNTPAHYDLAIGEFSIIPATSFAPVKPSITTAKSKIFQKRTYQGIDFKFHWNVSAPADHPSRTDKSYPIYNEDVDTWYYEVYIQAIDGEPILCGITSQWAHYIVGAPVSANQNTTQYRVGVCAVAPDGKTKSDITWSDYGQKEISLIDGIQSDKAVIKTNEEFTLSIIDPYQPAPKSWSIINSTTAAEVKNQNGSKEFKTSLTGEGYYDVVLTKADGTKLYYRGFVQISPEATGKVPSIESLAASKTEVDLVASTDPITLSYVGDKGEGNVSRGLEITDPYIFRIPAEFLRDGQSQYSIGLWIKPTKLSYAKFGISLINQRNLDIGWPNNNWGAIWCDIWPEAYHNGSKVMDANIVSYTMYNPDQPNLRRNFKGNYNRHEIPNIDCCTDGNFGGKPSYGLSEGTWSHVLISYDGIYQHIYFNGKRMADFYNDVQLDYAGQMNSPIYIGGSRVYYAGLNGVIDDVQVWHKALTDAEVQDAMKGYWGREVPALLKGYWTFEDVDYDADTKTFINRGTLNTSAKASYVEIKGAGGENTENWEEVLLPAQVNKEGNPAMSGTLPITTTATFTVGEITATTNTNEAGMELTQNGTFDLTLTLANGWGADTKTLTDYIVVRNGSGIDDVTDNTLSVYPNPFIDYVNLYFAEEGNYIIDLYDAQGRQVVSKKHQARANEVFTLNVNAEKGLYYVVVSKDGKRVNTFKVVAQ